jgi:hypothetical protein
VLTMAVMVALSLCTAVLVMAAGVRVLGPSLGLVLVLVLILLVVLLVLLALALALVLVLVVLLALLLLLPLLVLLESTPLQLLRLVAAVLLMQARCRRPPYRMRWSWMHCN